MPISYSIISSVTVGSGGSASIEFTSIPQTFDHLVIEVSLRQTSAVNYGVPKLQYNGLNNDTNHSTRNIRTDGGSPGQDLNSAAFIRRIPGGNIAANFFGSATVKIGDYASTTKYKPHISHYNSPSASSGTSALGMNASMWSNTNAITDIRIVDDNGSSFAQYSTATLYGIKNN
jgi:hypothetical protein